MSKWKIECDSLSDEDVEATAIMLLAVTGPFSEVVGVPRGGLRLAEAMKPYAGVTGPRLIVDDVLTTGGSMERTKALYDKLDTDSGGKCGTMGAVIFARGQCPFWVKCLFQMPEELWVKPRHR